MWLPVNGEHAAISIRCRRPRLLLRFTAHRPCITCLPVLVCCRLGPVSLACKAFAAAARSPELLREVDVVLANLPALRSFAAFLARHGQQLQRLAINCEDGTAEGEVAAAAAVTACLMAVGAGGQLAELSARGCIRSTDWLAAMPSLRQLQLEAQPHSPHLLVSPAVSALTSLSVLRLSGDLRLQAITHLPPSLEWLAVELDGSAGLPDQASGMCLKTSQVADSSGQAVFLC